MRDISLLCYVNYSSYRVNAFRVLRWKTVWKMLSLCIFRWFQSSFTYHDSCGPHWWLRSWIFKSSIGLYCNFWHIFRNSDKVTWCLEDLWLEQKRKESERERQRQNNTSNSSYLVEEVTPHILSLCTPPFVIFKKWYNRSFLNLFRNENRIFIVNWNSSWQ